MKNEELENIKKRYYDAVNGRKNRWLDPGEYEHLIREFFEKDVPSLLNSIKVNHDQEDY